MGDDFVAKRRAVLELHKLPEKICFYDSSFDEHLDLRTGAVIAVGEAIASAPVHRSHVAEAIKKGRYVSIDAWLDYLAADTVARGCQFSIAMQLVMSWVLRANLSGGA